MSLAPMTTSVGQRTRCAASGPSSSVAGLEGRRAARLGRCAAEQRQRATGHPQAGRGIAADFGARRRAPRSSSSDALARAASRAAVSNSLVDRHATATCRAGRRARCGTGRGRSASSAIAAAHGVADERGAFRRPPASSRRPTQLRHVRRWSPAAGRPTGRGPAGRPPARHAVLGEPAGLQLPDGVVVAGAVDEDHERAWPASNGRPPVAA